MPYEREYIRNIYEGSLDFKEALLVAKVLKWFDSESGRMDEDGP